MAEQDKIQELIDSSEDALLQKIIDRQEGALGLEEQNQSGPSPTQAELARWEQALNELEGIAAPSKTMPKRKRLGRIALLAILAAALLLVAASALYYPLMNWVESVHERYTQFQAGNDAQVRVDLWDAVYLPTNLPTDFAISDAFEFENIKIIEYANAEGERLIFYQYGPDANVQVDTEAANKTIVTLETGVEAYLIDKGSLSTLFWSDGGYGFSVEFQPDEIETAQIQAFAGGLQWKQSKRG